MKNVFATFAALVALPFCARAVDGSFNQTPVGGDPTATLIGASATLSNGVLTVTGTTQGAPTEWNHIFLGTDGNPDAGYIHSSGKKGGQGLNYLVEGGSLYHWTGLGDRKEWKWDKVATTTVTRTTTANSFTVSFPVQDLNLKAGGKLQIFLGTSNANYQTSLDTLPRNDALWQMDIPGSGAPNSATTAAAPATTAPPVASTVPAAAQAPAGLFTQPAMGADPTATLIGASATLTNGVLTVTGTTQGAPTEWNHIFLGTDGNPDAGYIHSSGKKGGQGLNYLVEGGSLYRWSGLGDRKEWKWDKVATVTVTRTTAANSFTVSFPVQDLNLKAGGKLQIFLGTANANYQTSLDTLPRNDALWLIDIPASGAPNSVATAAAPAAAAPPAASAVPAPAQAPAGSFTQPAVGADPTSTLIGASATLTNGVLTVTGTTQGAPTEWNHIFLGTDGNPAAGYIHSSGKKGGQGLNYLVEGGSLYHWTGLGDRTEWKWDKVGTTTITRTTAANSFTVSFPVQDLNLKAGGKLQIFLATSNANYQTPLDTLPRNDALWVIEIPAAALVVPKSAENSSPAVSIPSPDARARFKKITSYACYYGKDNVAQLAQRDAVIIETRSQTADNVAAIKKKMVRL